VVVRKGKRQAAHGCNFEMTHQAPHDQSRRVG
jgi:hypothetical protein